MSEKKRKNFSGQFKAKVALEVIRGVRTANEIAQEFGVHLTRQCELANVSRSTLSARHRAVAADEQKLVLRRAIDAEYTRHPFYGNRKMTVYLRRLGVKHEDVYLKGYITVPELLLGLTEYFVFYNTQRTYQSLHYRTPDEVYRTAWGKSHSRTEVKPGQRCPVACDRLPS